VTGAVVAFTLAGALLVILPGPDTMVVVRSILARGRPTAARTVAGVLTGQVVWVVAAVVGLSALVRASHEGYLALRLAGAVYLVTLGVRALASRATGADYATPTPTPGAGPDDVLAPDVPGDERASRGGILGHGFVAGLACDLLNPKVGVFFVTFLPGFVPRGAAVGPVSALLGGIFIVETAFYFGVLLALVDRVVRLLSSPTARRRLDRVTGLVLIGFGARLAAEG
jgi:threonine/homoserine/homoserine lactone efflux protein